MFARQKRKAREDPQIDLGNSISQKGNAKRRYTPEFIARTDAKEHNNTIRNFLVDTKVINNPRTENTFIRMNNVAFCDPSNSKWTRLGACSGLLERRFSKKVKECLNNSILIVSQDVKRVQAIRENICTDTEFSVLVLADFAHRHARIHLFGNSEDMHKYKTAQTQEIRLEKYIRGSNVIFDKQRSCFLEDSVPRSCFSEVSTKASLRDLQGCVIREVVLMDKTEMINVELSQLEHITVRDNSKLQGRVVLGTGVPVRPVEIYATGNAFIDMQGTLLESVSIKLEDQAECKGITVQNSLEVCSMSPDASLTVKLSSIFARFDVNLPEHVLRELKTEELATNSTIGNLNIQWTDNVIQHMREANIPTNTTPYLMERMRQLCELTHVICFEHEPLSGDDNANQETAHNSMNLLLAPSASFDRVVDLTQPSQTENTVFHTNRSNSSTSEQSAAASSSNSNEIRPRDVHARDIARARRNSRVVSLSATTHQFRGTTEHDQQLAPISSVNFSFSIREHAEAVQSSSRTRIINLFVHTTANNIEDVIWTRRVVPRRTDYTRRREHPLVLYNQVIRQRSSHWERMELSNELRSSVLPPKMAARMIRLTFGRVEGHLFGGMIHNVDVLARLVLRFTNSNAIYHVIRDSRLANILISNSRGNYGTFGGTTTNDYSFDYSDEEDSNMHNALLASDAQYRREQEARHATYSLGDSYRLEDMDDVQRKQIEDIRPIVPFIKRPQGTDPLPKDDPRLSSTCVICFDDESPPDVLPVGCACNPAKTIVCSDCTPLYIRRWDKCTICNSKITSLQQL